MGFGLAFLVGPIVFALIQTSLEYGYKFGLLVGLGIWLSDVCIILLVYNSLNWISSVITHPNFEMFVALIGGLILLAVGLAAFFSKKKVSFERTRSLQINGDAFLSLVKGVLINTVNPFTIIFWLGISTKILLADKTNAQDAFYFFAGIISVLVVTDSFKVLMADKLRSYMQPHILIRVRKISGVIFIGFGLFMLLKGISPNLIEQF